MFGPLSCWQRQLVPTFVVVRLYKHAAVGDRVQDEAPVVRTLGVGGCVGLMDSELPVRGHGQIQVLLTVETKRAEFLAVLSVLECVFSLAEYILKNKKNNKMKIMIQLSKLY